VFAETLKAIVRVQKARTTCEYWLDEGGAQECFSLRIDSQLREKLPRIFGDKPDGKLTFRAIPLSKEEMDQRKKIQPGGSCNFLAFVLPHVAPIKYKEHLSTSDSPKCNPGAICTSKSRFFLCR
jgi:hypothetical protein